MAQQIEGIETFHHHHLSVKNARKSPLEIEQRIADAR